MPRDAFAEPGPKILPSILASDFARLALDVADAEKAVGSGVIHIDIMDGHLVPNLSVGVPVVQSLRPALPDLFFDVHLMIDEPVRYAPAFVKAGGQNLTFQIEAPEVKNDPIAAAAAIRALGCRVGITLKPGTPVEAILPVIGHVDLVLVMSVEPGFGGQKFMPAMLDKVRRIRPLLRTDQRLEIDGGIDPTTIAAAREAGVDWFVVGRRCSGRKTVRRPDERSGKRFNSVQQSFDRVSGLACEAVCCREKGRPQTASQARPLTTMFSGDGLSDPHALARSTACV